MHLEMRDAYMPDPAFDAWRDGSREDLLAQDEDFQAWLNLVRETTARGVAIRRARVFCTPESDYIRWEHFISGANVSAGEDIRWLSRRNTTGIGFPGNDFWIFDDSQVLVQHFAGDGTIKPEWRELTTDPVVLDLCRSSFKAVWARAIPHADYKPS
ncbi:DUF6879 family protein [Streptomyces virginiae]